MNRSYQEGGMRLRLRAAVILVLIAAWSSASLADLRLGDFTFLEVPGERETNVTHLRDGLGSYAFCAKLRCIAFGAVAEPDNGLRFVAMAYDPSTADGARLVVTLADAGGRPVKVRAPLYDWQLVPVARFAADDLQTCFTLAGELKDREGAKARRARGERIMGYHPAFEHTLLGLRLMQADLLVLFPEACDLPKRDGQYLFGRGETAPDVQANRKALTRAQAVAERLEGGPFRSYVIGDLDRTVTFRAEKGELVLTGTPVWHCWKSKVDDEARLRKLEGEANTEADRVLDAERRRDAAALAPAALELKYTAAYCRQRRASVFDGIVTEALLVRMPAYSEALSKEILDQNGIHPGVCGALTATMRYAAFFRHVRKVDPTAYAAFTDSLADVRLEPSVRTPTVLVPPK